MRIDTNAVIDSQAARICALESRISDLEAKLFKLIAQSKKK